MGRPIAFHAPHGGADYIVLRTDDAGHAEIVYDDGATRHIVWRVLADGVSERRLHEALQSAVRRLKVLPALAEELRKRAIPVARIAG